MVIEPSLKLFIFLDASYTAVRVKLVIKSIATELHEQIFECRIMNFNFPVTYPLKSGSVQECPSRKIPHITITQSYEFVKP